MALASVIPALPLVGAAILLLTGRRWKGAAAGWFGSATVAAAFGVAVATFADLASKPVGQRLLHHTLFDWIAVGNFHVSVTFRVDPLSAVMALTVTGVGALIHLYAIDYMRNDPRYSRFFGYMNLFVFFMLILVLPTTTSCCTWGGRAWASAPTC